MKKKILVSIAFLITISTIFHFIRRVMETYPSTNVSINVQVSGQGNAVYLNETASTTNTSVYTGKSPPSKDGEDFISTILGEVSTILEIISSLIFLFNSGKG